MDEKGVKHYEIYGPLYFGSVSAFNDKFDMLKDADEIIDVNILEDPTYPVAIART